MILAAHQPAFMPFGGYLDRIAKADVFVFLNGVQFEKGSFTNRNRIKTQHGVRWLTVPVRARNHFSRAIKDLEIDPLRPWADTHIKTIRHAYSKAPRFFENMKELEWLYEANKGRLSDLCSFQLVFWLRQYGIDDTKLRLQPDLPGNPRKSDLVLRLCQHFKADTYLSGPFGRDYLDLPAFSKAGITVEFQEWNQPKYEQLWAEPFIQNLSILDMWMNTEENPFLSSQLTPMMKLSGVAGR